MKLASRSGPRLPLPAPALAALCACVPLWLAGCGADAASAPGPSPPGAAAAEPASGLPADLVYERLVGANQDLYVTPAGGGLERRLTDDAGTDGLPRWTRDGRSVVFTSNRTGNWQLWEMAAEGGAARRVRTNGSTDWQADESPDGRTLALLSKIDGPEALYLLDRATGAARLLIRHGKNMKARNTIFGNPHWSPEGARIVYSSNVTFGHQIYVADAAAGRERRISGLAAGGCEPRFSPDGRKVVYVVRKLWKVRSRLVEHDLASGEERVLVDWPSLNYDPVYSPDGAELAFSSNVTGEYQIYRQRIADGKSWRVTFGKGSARYPDYRPP